MGKMLCKEQKAVDVKIIMILCAFAVIEEDGDYRSFLNEHFSLDLPNGSLNHLCASFIGILIKFMRKTLGLIVHQPSSTMFIDERLDIVLMTDARIITWHYHCCSLGREMTERGEWKERHKNLLALHDAMTRD